MSNGSRGRVVCKKRVRSLGFVFSPTGNDVKKGQANCRPHDSWFVFKRNAYKQQFARHKAMGIFVYILYRSEGIS